MQDHYEVLQVHPKADQETIRAAYERLRQRYDATQLAGAADELVELARRKREDIEHAYAVLGDAVRRATYDAEQQALANRSTRSARQPGRDEPDPEEPALDYRPLPPANRAERPAHFNPQPTLAPERPVQQPGRRVGGRKTRAVWLGPAIAVATLTFLVMLTSLLLTGGGQMRYANDTSALQQAGNQTTTQGTGQNDHAQLFADYDNQVLAARQVAQQLPDNAAAWVRLGDALYDSVQVVREIQPDSQLYTERIPLWLEASEAYSKALELGATDKLVRSDMGVSLCYYGTGMQDASYVEQGLSHAQRAAEQATSSDASYGKILLNLGVCLVSADPPQTEQALRAWREVISVTPETTGLAQQARQLVEQYSQ